MSRVPQTAESPVPRPDAHTAPFWLALGRGELLVRECGVCRQRSHPVAELCRACESPQLGWTAVGDQGRIFSWVVEVREVIPGLTPPYTIVQVAPDGCSEGDVRIVGTLLEDDPARLSIGARVRLEPSPATGPRVPLAYFRLS